MLFTAMNEKKELKFILSYTDSDVPKICIQGMHKMFLPRQTPLQ